MPNAIDRMLGQYKKIAIGTVNVTKELRDGNITFPVSIDFIPSIFIVKIDPHINYFNPIFYVNNKDGKRDFLINSDGSNADVSVSYQNGNGIVDITNSPYYHKYTVKEYIAIE